MNRFALLALLPVFGACTAHDGHNGTHAPAGSTRAEERAPHEETKHGGTPQSISELAQGALILEDLGDYHYPISTRDDQAQQYFDQGLRLTYGFNHDEAARSYARAAVLDANCAMCFWGVALVLGPNYNVPMLADRAPLAWEALRRAKSLSGSATPTEQALIEALSKRYKGPEPVSPEAMQPWNEAYAAAMRQVITEFPGDLDVQTMFAEAMMDVNPWKLWTLEGTPSPGTEEIVSTLESVLARNPNHPGANHFYIHAVEASAHPEKALPSAQRLPLLMPGAGHVVHMPAHIYQRVGEYAEASAANRKAAALDESYIQTAKPWGYYPMYLGHNYGFLAFSASMEGRSAEALDAARRSAAAMPAQMVTMMPGMDFFSAAPVFAMVRFARWDELLKEPRPDPKYQVSTGLWLHGHAMALAAKGRLADAKAEHRQLLELADAVPAELRANLNSAKDELRVGAKVLEADIATRERRPEALAVWAEAVALQDKLAYAEPADWFYPIRHFQGAALLGARKAKEAEAVYREDLRRNPKNGWALYGLAEALRAQGKKREASAVMQDFATAWQHADIRLSSSIAERLPPSI
jgi:tetratricopeptide (TPR) repeat protein